MRKQISWHFLRRRADKRKAQVLRAQREARYASSQRGWQARERLERWGIASDDRIEVERKGKYDARFLVVAYTRSSR